tara:strand:- start:107 stop:532 length:426 start_codon:yes stop_codon:yes gene_type:complete
MKKYFELAQNIADIFSHDERFKVGSVILNRKNFDILSVGYNRFSDIDDEKMIKKLNKSPNKYNLILHAEYMAIEIAKKYSLPVNNNIIITTQFPCWDCAKLIVKNKLSKVFTYKRPLKGPWWDDEPVLELFKNNKLEICYD